MTNRGELVLPPDTLTDEEIRRVILLMLGDDNPTARQMEEFRAGWEAGRHAHALGEHAPQRTPEMLEARQVWVRIGDHWEIRGTGVSR